VNLFKKLLAILTPREQRRALPIIIGSFISGLIELAGIGSLGPFMAVAADASIIHTQHLLSWIYTTFGFSSDRVFLIWLGVGVFAFIIIATATKMFVLYMIYKWSGNRRYTLSLRLFKRYLYQPYSFFLDNNSSELSSKLLTNVDLIIGNVLMPGIDFCSKVIITIVILTFLTVINPIVSIFAFFVFGGLFFLIFKCMRPRLMRYGEDIGLSNMARYKATSEAFGGIKDIKILGKENVFIQSYDNNARIFSQAQAKSQILSVVPSQAIQALAVGFAVVLIVVMLGIRESIISIIPILSIYAYAILRLIPNIQALYQDAGNIRTYNYIIDTIHKQMNSLPVPAVDIDIQNTQAIKPLNIRNSLELQNITFSYPLSHSAVLDSITLKIEKNTTVGFIGSTGCGKTTLVDVIMGLLEPLKGTIISDDEIVISANNKADFIKLSSWQRNFGYVPQQIYLSDDTVAANIAFGIPEAMRDKAAIERAAKVSNLYDFIMEELPAGFDTVVGERGVRLSGGQRQRVGIARSLYNDPCILVMDEATSALDSITEDAVMDAIHNLMHSKTIIIIAHRLSTVKECDVIYMMEKGKISDSGTWDELFARNKKFAAMAKVRENRLTNRIQGDNK
jgi:ABC-type multidrug transport system fused ATPase/permease subunit